MKRFPRNIKGILQTVESGLCHRCGGCVGGCPVDALYLDEDCFPAQKGECIGCDLCMSICSGSDISFSTLGKELFGREYKRDSPMGVYLDAQVGAAIDKDTRFRATCGGVVTELLGFLLDTGKIDGALVVGEHPERPEMGMGYIARTREELTPSSQSRYTTAPLLHELKAIAANEQGRYAVVALPCHVHTLRKLQQKRKKWREKISLIIGLYCHYRLPHEATRDVADIVGGKGRTLQDVRYRKKEKQGWPHNTVSMRFTDGMTWRSPYGPAQTVSLLGYCYPKGRCLHCVDALAEFADLAVGDPWIRDARGGWKYHVPEGLSAVLVRTTKGETLLQDAVASGVMVMERIEASEVLSGQHAMIYEKYSRAMVRMWWQRLFGKRVPEYHLGDKKFSFSQKVSEIPFFISRLLVIHPKSRRILVQLGFSRAGRRLMSYRREWNRKKAIQRQHKTPR